jgi:hypothetical protein
MGELQMQRSSFHFERGFTISEERVVKIRSFG